MDEGNGECGWVGAWVSERVNKNSCCKMREYMDVYDRYKDELYEYLDVGLLTRCL